MIPGRSTDHAITAWQKRIIDIRMQNELEHLLKMRKTRSLNLNPRINDESVNQCEQRATAHAGIPSCRLEIRRLSGNFRQKLRGLNGQRADSEPSKMDFGNANVFAARKGQH